MSEVEGIATVVRIQGKVDREVIVSTHRNEHRIIESASFTSLSTISIDAIRFRSALNLLCNHCRYSNTFSTLASFKIVLFSAKRVLVRRAELSEELS